ncbi:MAG: antibiotic biosynthesis monooxygenase [Actinobacteria bacterium]|nr:antibiotic biosynthesis monooxygenase [Actinomycetota bacterium]
MIVNCVTVWVKPERVGDFIAETIANHEASTAEAGNMRFDVLQSIDEPGRFLLYEAYESREAAAAHKETAHYKAWRDAVADWMERPREGVSHRVIRPLEREAW